MLLTATVDDFTTGAGVAITGHGYAVPVEVAKTWLEPEARAMLVLLSKTRGITAYSSLSRLFTEQQRLAMAARDGGCSFPGCDLPVALTQAHHVTEHANGGATRVDNGALVCHATHRTFEKAGWINRMHHGQPHWMPPDTLDPSRRLRLNTLHDRQ